MECWLWHGITLAIWSIWEVDPQIEDVSLSLHFKHINERILRKESLAYWLKTIIFVNADYASRDQAFRCSPLVLLHAISGFRTGLTAALLPAGWLWILQQTASQCGYYLH